MEVSEAAEFVEIVPGEALRLGVAESLGAPAAAELAEVSGLSDPVLVQCAFRTRAHALGGRVINAVEAEEMVVLLLARLMQTHLGARMDRAKTFDTVLDDRRKHRVFDYIETHIDETVALDQLADVAALSKYHFVRAFKATTGVTPGRYLQSRKIEAARRMLLAGASSEHARHSVAISSASHFNELFRRELGVTPGRYLASSQA